MTETPTCTVRGPHGICGARIARLHTEIDPRRCTYRMVAQCGHTVAPNVAAHLWRAGYRWSIPLIDGATLIDAERTRQVTEEGYTPEHDAGHGEGLPWAAWSYLDRAVNPTAEPSGPPTMWPWEETAWKADASPLRHLVIAGALIAAEIDRRLHAQHTSISEEAS